MATPKHGKAAALTGGTPTQVAHPWRAVIRTFVAWVVGFLVAWLARTLGVDLTDLSEAMTDSITVGVWAVATGFAQWLLTRPGVVRLLEYTPLSTGVETEPRGYIPPEAASGT